MDVSREDDDCDVKVVIPAKKKKLKQGNLFSFYVYLLHKRINRCF